jgi:hypothetical protein
LRRSQWFRDDKEFAVLQAADLLAGEIRILVEQDIAQKPVPSFLDGWCPHLKAAGHFKLIAEQEMREMDAFTKAAMFKEPYQE